LWGAYRVPYSHVPKWRVGSLKRIYPLHNISTKIVGLETKIVCVRDQWFWIFISMGSRSSVSGSGSLALTFFVHWLWVVFRLGINNRSNYAELSKALSTSVEMSTTWITPGSLCLTEVVTRYGTFGIQSCFLFFCKQEIVDLICGEIDCEHKLVDWFVQFGELNHHFTFWACMFVVSQIGNFCLICSNERMQFYLFETIFQVSHLQNNLCMTVMGAKHILNIKSWDFWLSHEVLHFPLIVNNHKWSSYCSKDAFWETNVLEVFFQNLQVPTAEINILSCWRWKTSLIT
jgi:hypothetical protein